MTMRAATFSSTVISKAAYDEEARSLSIWFRETGRYIYSDVPRTIYEGLKKAPSAGRPDPERRKFRPRFGD
jgi:hypothetical protein